MEPDTDNVTTVYDEPMPLLQDPHWDQCGMVTITWRDKVRWGIGRWTRRSLILSAVGLVLANQAEQLLRSTGVLR